MFVLKKKVSAEGAAAQRWQLITKAAGMAGFFVVLRLASLFMAPKLTAGSA